MKKLLIGCTIVLLTLGVAAQDSKSSAAKKPAAKQDAKQAPKPPETRPAKVVTTPSGLKYQDLVEGAGETPNDGDQVIVHYTGWLLSFKKFDSSVDRGEPFAFQLGRQQVIKGWDEGVATMKVGGKRKLVIPPDLAYGEQANGMIPANSTLIFEVELLAIKK
jgi:peptidylprolyl isomerase